jgi:hypothetical protein
MWKVTRSLEVGGGCYDVKRHNISNSFSIEDVSRLSLVQVRLRDRLF